jgi:hypothetical protein
LQAIFNAKTSAATTTVAAKIIDGTNYLNIGRLKNLKKHVTPRHDYSAPSRTVTNSAKYKTEAWKRYQVIKTKKKKSKKKQLMEHATYSVLAGTKTKVEPHQFCQRQIFHLRILLHASQHHSP